MVTGKLISSDVTVREAAKWIGEEAVLFSTGLLQHMWASGDLIAEWRPSWSEFRCRNDSTDEGFPLACLFLIDSVVIVDRARLL